MSAGDLREPALAAPTAGDGVAWRPLQATDLAGLAELVARCEAADDPPYRTTAEELAEDLFAGANRNPERDTIAALTPSGRVLAYARVRLFAGAQPRVFLGGGVDPEVRRQGIGSQLLTWQVERARALLAPSGRGTVATYAEDGMRDQCAILERAGFAPARYYTELRRDLSRPIPAVTLGGSLIVEPWQPQLDEEVRLAHNEAFADHWGSDPQTAETWREGSASFVPEWSFLVMDRSSDRTRVAGYLVSGRYEQDWAALGYRLGYTDLLGVRRQWRNRRVATALLTAAMRAYAASGMEFAGLGVDSETREGDLGLFARLGYTPVRGSALWTLEVDASPAPSSSAPSSTAPDASPAD